MKMVEYTLDENLAVITLNSSENRFNPDFLNSFLEVLDDIEKNTEAATIMVKSAHEKIFSNGIDLEWLVPVIQQNEIQKAKDFFYLLNQLFKKTLTCPLITVACLTGHAFAGGAIWSCAFDFRFMRSDRGYFCFPEVDLGIPFLPGMLKLLKKAIPMHTMEYMHHTGARLTANECEQNNIIIKACHIDTLEQETYKFAKSLNKKRAVIKEMKQRLYKDIIHTLDVEDISYIESGRFNIG